MPTNWSGLLCTAIAPIPLPMRAMNLVATRLLPGRTGIDTQEKHYNRITLHVVDRAARREKFPLHLVFVTGPVPVHRRTEPRCLWSGLASPVLPLLQAV